MSILTLENVRTMMKETIQEYRSRHPVFSPNDDARDDALFERLEQPFTNWEQVAAFNTLYSPNFRALLGGMYPTDCYKPSCFQFGQGDSGWYFTYFSFGDVTMTFVVFRLPVVSPAVSKKHGLNMDETCVYLLTGFLNSKEGPYLPIHFFAPANPPPQSPSPQPYCYYKCVGNSTMELQAVGPGGETVSWSGNPSLNQMTLKIKTSTIDVDVTTSSGVDKVWNGEGGCSPACIAGTGSLYWSYTDMDVQGTVQGKKMKGTRNGWFDHQWKNSQRPGMWLLRLIDNLAHIGSPPTPLKWNWFTIQLPECQYMIFVGYSENPVRGKVYKAGFANKYVGSNRTNVKATVVVEKNTVFEGISFPTQVRIQVDGQTFTLINEYKHPNIVRLGSQVNWEGVATIQERSDGQGFLESNSFQDPTKLLTMTATQAGFQDATPFIPRKLAFKEYAPSLFMTIFLILLILFILVGIPILAVYYRNKSKKNKP